jgi:hypothetical protein
MLDWTWMYEARRTCHHFREELNKFIKVAEIDVVVEKKRAVVPPCKKCKHIRVISINETISMRSHVLMNGFVEDYMI